MKKTISLVLTLAMAFSLLAGCSSSTTADTSSSTSSTTTTTTDSSSSSTSSDAAEATDSGAEPDGIVAGTSANFYSTADCVTLLRPGEEPSAHWMYQMIYDTLFYAPYGDYEDGLEGLVAKDWTLSDDSRVWTVNIHEDIYYSNGKNMTAEDVVRCFQILSDTGQEAIFTPMESYEATGEYQITFTYKEPNPEFMYQFCVSHLGLFDPEGVDTYGDTTDSYLGAGSGPYYITEYATGDYIKFAANENYWCEDRMPHIESITCKVILDSNTQITALQSGEMQFGPVAFYDGYETLAAATDLVVEEFHGLNRCLWVNPENGNEYLANIRVREALTLMIDEDELAAAASGGYGYALSNPFGVTVDYDDERVYDPDAGLAILAEEGIDPADIVIYPITNAETPAIFANFQAQMSEYGITVDYTVQDAPAVISAGWAGEWDIWAENGGMNRYAFASCLTMMFGETGMHNICRDSAVDPTLWALVVDAFSAEERDEEMDLIADMAQVLDENYLYLAAVQVPSWNAYDSDVLQGVYIDQYNGSWLPWYAWVA